MEKRGDRTKVSARQKVNYLRCYGFRPPASYEAPDEPRQEVQWPVVPLRRRMVIDCRHAGLLAAAVNTHVRRVIGQLAQKYNTSGITQTDIDLLEAEKHRYMRLYYVLSQYAHNGDIVDDQYKPIDNTG